MLADRLRVEGLAAGGFVQACAPQDDSVMVVTDIGIGHYSVETDIGIGQNMAQTDAGISL